MQMLLLIDLHSLCTCTFQSDTENNYPWHLIGKMSAKKDCIKNDQTFKFLAVKVYYRHSFYFFGWIIW